MGRITASLVTVAILTLGSAVHATERADGEPPAALPANVADAPVKSPDAAVKAPPSKARATARPSVTLNLKVDLAAQRVTVIDRGKVRHVWPISSGRRGFATPTGKFVPQWTALLHHSTQYDDAPMPHSVFFTGGVAFHGTTDTANLGRPASHGCVRLAPSHAAQLYALVHRHGLPKTRVTVHGVPYGQATAGRERRRGPREVRSARQDEVRRPTNVVFGRSGR
jgi:hypothetical protein